MRLHRDPGTTRRDAHRLVVEAAGTARRERVVEPVAVLGRECVGDVGERTGALVGRNDEVGVVAVASHDVGRRDDLAIDEVVGELQQAADERLVRGLRVAALHVEPALGPDGDDDRVLHRLRLHEPEHLGAEVFAPVRPADAATGDVTRTQVDSFDRRRSDPDLVLRVRLGQEVERSGIELARDVRLAAVRVGAHRRAHHLPERAEDPVGVEADHGIDRAPELLVEVRLERSPVGVVACARRVEPRVEARHEQTDRVGVVVQRVGEVRIGEAHTRLPQVLAQRPHDDDVAHLETRVQHQAVEPVVLDRARPHPEEHLGDACLRGGVGQRITGRRHHTERIDPTRAVGRGDLVRVLVDDGHPELLEQRHHVGEHERAPRPVQLDVRDLLAPRRFEPHLQIAGGIEVAEHLHVVDGDRRRHLGLVRGRERVAPTPGLLDPGLLTERVDERVVQVVDPVAGDGREPGLECFGIDVGDAGGGVDDDLQARHHLLGDEHGEVRAGTVVGLAQRVDHEPAHVGRVAVAGQVHEARDEAAHPVATHEQPHAPAQAHAHDRQRERGQLVGGEPEELVARVRGQHVDQAATVVAVGRQPRARQHRGHLLADDGDPVDVVAVDVGGVEPEETQLSTRRAVGVQHPHGHRVERDVAVHRRPLARG